MQHVLLVDSLDPAFAHGDSFGSKHKVCTEDGMILEANHYSMASSPIHATALCTCVRSHVFFRSSWLPHCYPGSEHHLCTATTISGTNNCKAPGLVCESLATCCCPHDCSCSSDHDHPIDIHALCLMSLPLFLAASLLHVLFVIEFSFGVDCYGCCYKH